MINIEKFAQMITASCGVRVIFDQEAGQPPYAILESSEIHMPKRESLWMNSDEDIITNILHEAGHINYTDMIPKEKYDAFFSKFPEYRPQDLFDCINLVEDVRVDYLMSKRFVKAYNLFRDQFVRIIDDRKNELKKLSKARLFLFILFDCLFGVAHIPYDINEKISDDVYNISINDNHREVFTEIIRTTTELITQVIIPKIYPVYIKYLDKLTDEEKDAMKNMDKLQEAFEEFLKENIDEIRLEKKSRVKQQKKNKECVFNFKEEDIDNAVNKVCLRSKMKKLQKNNNDYKVKDVEDVVAKLKPAIDLLKDQSYDRILRGTRRGKICSPKLYKVMLDSTRVFQKKLAANKNADILVSILIDCSGSMYGNKIDVAAHSAYAIAKALQRAKKPCIINAFNDNFHSIKEPNKNMTQLQTLEIMHNVDGGTYEGDAIKNVMKQLKKHNETRKIIIVINDGSPSDGEVLEKEIKRVPNDVEIIAIGVESDSVKDYYDNAIVINDVSELPNVLTNTIKQLIKIT